MAAGKDDRFCALFLGVRGVAYLEFRRERERASRWTCGFGSGLKAYAGIGTFTRAHEEFELILSRNAPVCCGVSDCIDHFWKQNAISFALGAVCSQHRSNMLRRQYAENSLVVRVGMRIRKLRTEQGRSLREFGMHAGVHPFHVMAIELGQLAANTKTLQSIAKGLGVAPLDLLNHDSENDDMGHIIELMRKQPDCVGKIMIKVKLLVEN